MYQVLARKWRPQTLDELVGQPHVARTLKNAIGGGRIAHAYVFAGLRGTGKTSVARILAKSLNCEQGPTGTPCNHCVACTEIMEGRSLDVMELDAASRTGVDNIRELQEVVSYAPVRDRYRILIIDEAHMLSKAAFNALLKTLEEPPPRVVFILATTEVQKLLPTILSRCQVFEFHRVPLKSIVGHLRHIAGGEGLTVSDATLERVARAGEGSMRDALSVLERVLAFCGAEVADEDALQVLGAVRTEVLLEFVRGIADRDAASLLAALDALVGDGHDLVHFWGELVGVVRDLMLLRVWPKGSDALARTPDEVRALIESAGDLGLEDWTRVFQILAGLEFGLKSSSQPRFLFEGALIRMAALGSVRPIEEILAALQGGPQTPSGVRAPVAGTAPAAPKPPGVPKARSEAAAARPESLAPVPSPTPAPAPPPIAEGFQDVREALVAAVTQARPMLGGYLRHAASIVIDGGTLLVTFAPADKGIRRSFSSEDNASSLETIASETLGRRLTLRVAGSDEPAAVTAKPKTETQTPRVQAAGQDASRGALADRAKKDPAVRRILEEFGAQVVDVRPVRAEDAEAAMPGEENG